MTRTVDVKFLVLRGGAVFTELNAVNTPTLRMDNKGELKVSLSGEFVEDKSIDWLNDEVQPILIIDGEETPLGVFLPATVKHAENETTRSVHIELYDRTWLVRDSVTESRVYFPAGTSYINAIKQLLLQANITLVQAEPISAVLTEAREDWDIGTSFLTIINQLLSEINYNPLWFNSSGLAILEPATVPTAENIDHTLNGSDIRSLIVPEVSSEMDIYNAPNVFVCTCSNPDKTAAYRVTVENTNPQSPLSIPRRGRRIVRVERVNNIYSLEGLKNYAKRLRNESMMAAEVIQIETALHPGFEVYDVTAINYKDIFGICAETGWTMELVTGGRMTHTLERVVYAFE